jgi:hypothetical protein
MLRVIGGIIAAPVVWIVVATILSFGLRHGYPGYAAVEKARAFTLGMLFARLTVSFVSTIAAGAATAAITRNNFLWPLIAGIVMLACFLPDHISIWPHYPVWYHLTFFVSLPVFSVIGGRFSRVV